MRGLRRCSFRARDTPPRNRSQADKQESVSPRQEKGAVRRMLTASKECEKSDYPTNLALIRTYLARNGALPAKCPSSLGYSLCSEKFP